MPGVLALPAMHDPVVSVRGIGRRRVLGGLVSAGAASALGTGWRAGPAGAAPPHPEPEPEPVENVQVTTAVSTWQVQPVLAANPRNPRNLFGACLPVIVGKPATEREPAHEHADIRYVLSTATPDEARPENPSAELRWLTIADAFELTDEANMRESLSRVERLLDAA